MRCKVLKIRHNFERILFMKYLPSFSGLCTHFSALHKLHAVQVSLHLVENWRKKSTLTNACCFQTLKFHTYGQFFFSKSYNLKVTLHYISRFSLRHLEFCLAKLLDQIIEVRKWKKRVCSACTGHLACKQKRHP